MKFFSKIFYLSLLIFFIPAFVYSADFDLDPFNTKKNPLSLDIKNNFTISHDKQTEESSHFNNLIFRAKWFDELYKDITGEVHLVDILTYQSDDSLLAPDIFSDSPQNSFLINPLASRSSVSGDLTNLFYVDRLNLHFKLESTDITAGRQAVTYGKTFFWTPLDWLSPFSPYSIDREYKQGVDALSLRHYPSNLSEFGMTLSFGKNFKNENSGYVMHFRNNVNDWDIVIQLGLVRDRNKVGLGISGDPEWLGGAALRSEISTSNDAVQGTIGIEYRFTGGLYFLWEYYYNGFGTTDRKKYMDVIEEGYLGSETFQLGQHLTGINMSYEFTPLLAGNLSFVTNINDLSGLIMPYMLYSLNDEADLSAGLYIPFGDDSPFPDLESEFGFQPWLFYAQVRMVF